jgi:CRISPR/Cas system-associated exonuclease Cas4 (RecB family)
MTFLEKLVENIYNSYGENISSVCFVLPNRRAGLYLKKYLSQKINHTIWSPAIFSIEDFACHISGLSIVDQTTLVFEFYNVYAKIEGSAAQPFDDFMNWAQILLKDYNDSDINLVDTEKLFKYLHEAKKLGQWDLQNTKQTEHEKEYLAFYKSLGKYYAFLKEILLKKKCGYQGLIHKEAINHLETFLYETEFNKIIFAGFNALTTSEEKIISTLLKSGKAEIFWDADTYYVNDNIQEAGDFLRKYLYEWKLKNFNWLENHFAVDEKNISITGVPMHVGQTVFAGQLLSEMSKDIANSENTAVVLADESLLIPLLYSIPENIQDINITMGYPLSRSTVHSLFLNIFTLHEDSRKYSSNGNFKFYQKDIVNIFNHPYFRLILQQKDFNEIFIFSESVKKSNKLFYTAKELNIPIKNKVIASLFDDLYEKPLLILDAITAIIAMIRDILLSKKNNKINSNEIDVEYLFNYAVIISKIRDILGDYGFIKDIKSLKKIFSGLTETATIPFYGEPLKGLQIMGMLETRSLDFENIILLSVNENILPAGKFQNTFVPYDIRSEMGLSTYKQKESIFAYHFYRLLQRAKNIHILYNTQIGDFGSGEKSRFITQIEKELPKYNSKIIIKSDVLVADSSPANLIEEISIAKSKEILTELESIAVTGFSPSALNVYISCPLKFYFQYIEKIEEAETTADTIDAATLGSVVHFVLFELYKDLKNKVITTADIQKMHGMIEKLITAGFKEYYPEGNIDSGKNLLIAKVATRFVKNFLQQETDFIKKSSDQKRALTILRLEEFCDTIIEMKTKEGKPLSVKLKGFIDRIDIIDETLRIIDYKTGIVKSEELKFSAWDQLISEPLLSKSLQLLIYSYLFSKKYYSENVQTGIITFRNLSKGFMAVNCPDSNEKVINKDILMKIEEIIVDLFSQIYSKDIPFSQTDDAAICQNCIYVAICNK